MVRLTRVYSFIFLLTIFAASCATGAPATTTSLSSEEQRVLATFESVNQKMFGDVALGRSVGFDKFDDKAYRELLAGYGSDRADAMKSYLKDFSILQVSGHPVTFVACIFSPDRKLAICDDPRCTGTEKWRRVDSVKDIPAVEEGLPIATCPKH